MKCQRRWNEQYWCFDFTKQIQLFSEALTVFIPWSLHDPTGGSLEQRGIYTARGSSVGGGT